MSLRRLLACLLLVALPWQGVAAAAMVLCGPATPAAAAHGGTHDGAQMHAAAGDEHAMHHGHGDDHHSLHAPHADGGHAHAGHGLQADAGHHCSACSLCGHALALPGTPVTFQSLLPPQGPSAGAWLRPDSRVAPLPDKPPRA